MFFDQVHNQEDSYSGDFYQSADGEFYYDEDGGLEGIGSFFKKIGKGILKIAPIGLSFIPGIGGLSAGLVQKIAGAGLDAAGSIGSGGSGGGGVMADVESAATQVSQQMDVLIGQMQSGAISREDGVNGTNRLVQAYQDATDVLKDKKARGRSIVLRNQLWDKWRTVQTLPINAPVQTASPSALPPNAIILPSGQTVVPQTAANGTVTYVPVAAADSSDGGGGFDTGTLALFGIGGLALILVLKN